MEGRQALWRDECFWLEVAGIVALRVPLEEWDQSVQVGRVSHTSLLTGRSLFVDNQREAGNVWHKVNCSYFTLASSLPRPPRRSSGAPLTNNGGMPLFVFCVQAVELQQAVRAVGMLVAKAYKVALWCPTDCDSGKMRTMPLVAAG